jgi:16S rRNA (guanine966-N2)-methyltransferase
VAALRVVSGVLGGRALKSPPGTTRPTQDRVRAALFDILGPRVAAARVLDLYAGSGALGIEALSRGAASAVFVERGRAASAVLEENLRALGLGGRFRLLRLPVARALALLGREGARFDLVLADPPYALAPGAWRGAAGALLAPGGLLVVETAARRPPQSDPDLDLVRRAVYGDTALEFWRPGDGAGGMGDAGGVPGHV